MKRDIMKEKSFKKKNELIEAALNEFTMKSYENASLNKIIKNAGISKGTFYYHFQDKQALYIFLQESAYEAEMEFQNDRMNEVSEDFKGKDIFEMLKLTTKIGVEFAIAYPEYLKLIVMYMNEVENKENKKILEYINSFRKKTLETGIEIMINKAISDGDFNDRFSKDFIMKIMNHLFLHYTEIFPMEEYYEMPKFIDDINNFIEFLKYGFGKQKGGFE
jgi:TetR/AcrR family transcriptional regulator